MASPYNGNAANATGTQVTITEPDDGDDLTAASGNTPWSKLADWAQRLLDLALAIGSTAWTFTQLITFQDGIVITASTTNRKGIEVTGNGIERAVFATGGSSDGTAIRAIGGGTNGWGLDASADGTGTAIYGEATGSGNAMQADASTGTGTAFDVIGNNSAPAATITAAGSEDALQLTGPLTAEEAEFTGPLTATGGIAHMTPLVVGSTGAAFQNSFTAGGPGAPRYWKDALGVVHVDGSTTNTTTPGATAIVFTLPSGYRPTRQLTFSVYNATGGAQFQCVVETNGDFKLDYSVANQLVYFDGITFPTF